MLEATMNDPIVETDNDEDKMKCSTVEIEESFEDMNEDTVETNNIERVDKPYAITPFDAETFQIGEMWLKISVDMEEDFEEK